MKKIYAIPAILLVLSFVLAACGEATLRPVVNLNASELFLQQPGFVEVTMTASDNSFNKQPTSCTVKLGDETETIAVENGTWTGQVWLGQTTTITSSCSNEAGQIQDALTITVANGTSTTAESYLNNPATKQNSCLLSGGRQTWDGAPFSDFEWITVINKEALKDGITLQPFHSESASWAPTYQNATFPPKFEDHNDAAQTLTCWNEYGNISTWVFDRTGATSVPFYTISAIKLNSNGSVTVWEDDDTGPGGWEGNGSGNHYTYSAQSAFTSWDDILNYVSTEDYPGFIKRNQSIRLAIESLDDGLYTLPVYGELRVMWRK